MKTFEENMEKILDDFKEKEKIQDFLLIKTRLFIRNCAVGIKYIHQKKFIEAKKQINKNEKILKQINNKKVNDMDYLLNTAKQEYCEIRILYSIIKENKILLKEDLKVDSKSYLLGLMDCIGELRRELIDFLIEEDLENAKKMLKFMIEIYQTTLVFKISNSLLPNFKKKQDVARQCIEKSKSDLFLFQTKTK